MKDRQALKPKPRLPVMDRCANYNALGRDPDGRLTYLAALFWGRSFVPQCSTQQFVGPPEPPRFGPPAPYQVACLPPGWKPQDPPDFYGAGDAFGPLFLDPPTGIFDPNIFAALKHIARFQWGDGELLEALGFSG